MGSRHMINTSGFGAGATVGGATISLLGVATISLVTLTFVAGSIIIATTLRHVIDQVGKKPQPPKLHPLVHAPRRRPPMAVA